MTPVSEETVRLWIMSAYGVLWLRYQGLLHVVAQLEKVPTETIQADVERWIGEHRAEQDPIILKHLKEILSSVVPQP